MIYAANKGFTHIVRHLIDNSADLNILNYRGMTALDYASKWGYIDCFELLKDSGAICNINNYFVCMIANGKTDKVKKLLQEGVNANFSFNDNFTALMCASFHGHYAISKLLIENGADVNAKELDHFTALILAAQEGHSEIVKLLLDSGAYTNIISRLGSSALTLAEHRKYYNIVKLLKQYHSHNLKAEVLNCKTCRNVVSASAAICPHCGENFPTTIITCSKCGSSNIFIDKKGFSFLKALAGKALLGNAGLLGGFIGSNDIELNCKACGYVWWCSSKVFKK